MRHDCRLPSPVSKIYQSHSKSSSTVARLGCFFVRQNMCESSNSGAPVLPVQRFLLNLSLLFMSCYNLINYISIYTFVKCRNKILIFLKILVFLNFDSS